MWERGTGDFQTFSSGTRSSNRIFNDVIVAPGNSTLGLCAANSSPPVRVSNFNHEINHKLDDTYVLLQRT